jgi:carbon monoxide dehydrogenase subunit G
MHLDGQFTIGAPRPDVYAFLTDPARVSRHLPDVKNVVIEDADHFTVTARVGVSHIKGDVVMKLTIKDRQPPISTTVVGKGVGLASAVDMVTSFTLDETADGTVVNWRGDVTISGKLAAFGPQGLLDRIGRKNVDTFIEGIRAGLAETASSHRG